MAEQRVISVSPNPTMGNIRVTGVSGTVSVIDLSGKVVFNNNEKTSSREFDLTCLKSGAYFLKDESNQVVKLVKK